jgi:2-dehydro-3-deoxygalactonokinase
MSHPKPAVLLAVDWGTTNCRAWTVDASGAPLSHQSFLWGVAKLERGEAARRFIQDVRPALDADALPALLTGMIGSTLGWIEAPYADCPAGAEEIARALVSPQAKGPPVRIVPGLRCVGVTGAADVMRGEETQIVGWLQGDPARRRGVHIVCHPGTHAKWARVVEGRIERFVTLMTGELFDVLGAHSVLKFGTAVENDAAFDAGVAAAGDGGALAARLFSARGRVVGGGGADPASAKSYLSGLLIGADVAAAPDLIGLEPGQPVALVGDERLCALYGRALEARGKAFTVHSGEEAVLAGLALIHRLAEGCS